MPEPAPTPAPPYFAVIFTSRRQATEGDGYAETAARMEELAREQPGFLGIESARGADGLGITISYWRDEASIAAWKAHAEHQLAQQQGRAREAFLIFKQNPFDSRLGSHKIQKLSVRYGRVIYAAEIEANLRVVFYIERNTVLTVDIGSHDLYR